MNLPTSKSIFSPILTGYLNDQSANLTLILVGLSVSRDNFMYKEYGIRLMLAPRSAKALHEKALLKLHGIRKLPESPNQVYHQSEIDSCLDYNRFFCLNASFRGLNHCRGNHCKNKYDESQASVRDLISCWEKARISPRSQSKIAGGMNQLMKAVRSSSHVSIVPSLSSSNQDLEALWNLVEERFSTTKPKNLFDDFLLITLGAMFEKPDIHAQIWKNQRSVHGPAKVKGWMLLESCGVQIITFTTTQLILLVERKYPLTRFTLDQMLNAVRLEVEEESEVSLELLRFIRQQHQ
nr:hypothetical protein [Tanacetum cinerariifolium]